MHVATLQQIRGVAWHFESANVVLAYLTAPVDSLMCFGDERSDWEVCPNKEIWGDFRRTMEVVETHIPTESAWRALFEGQMIRMIKPEERLSLKLEKGVSVWISVDATMEWISGVSWNGRQFFRVRVIDFLHYFPSRMQEPFRIAECELMAAVFAILMWLKVDGVIRHIIRCAANQNVFRWVSKSKAQLGAPNRIIRRLVGYSIREKIDVSPAYLRSARNLTADGLTRWADAEVSAWLHDQRMQQAAVPLDWLQGLDLLTNLPDERPLTNSQALLHLMDFFKTSNNRVFEWRPGCYTTASLLASWGIPLICYGLNYPH